MEEYDKELQIFISYSFADKNIMNMLKNILQSNGITCYVAQHDEDLGGLLSEKLEKAIDESDTVIVILTKNSVSSSSVGSEIGYAKRAGIRIIPLIESGVPMPVFLQGREEVRFTHNTIDDACRKISKFIDSKFLANNEYPLDDVSTEETVIIKSGEYQAYSYDLDDNEVLFGQINSDIPVNVYIVNDRNLNLLDTEKEFTAEYSTESVKRCKINFQPSRSGTWNVVILNEEDDNEEDGEVEVFLNIK